VSLAIELFEAAACFSKMKALAYSSALSLACRHFFFFVAGALHIVSSRSLRSAQQPFDRCKYVVLVAGNARCALQLSPDETNKINHGIASAHHLSRRYMLRQ